MMIKKILSTAALFAMFAGCAKPSGQGYTYIFPEGPGDTVSADPADSSDPGDTSEDVLPSEAPSHGEESTDPVPSNKVPCFLWVDSSANSPDFLVSEDNIRRDLKLAADAGFTHIIAEVRPTTGDLLFKSSHCDQVEFLGAWVGGVYTKIPWDQSFDYLQSFIDIGHELGLKIYAGFNTFVAGRETAFGKQGIAFRDPDMMKLVTVQNTSDGLATAADISSQTEYFFNPVHEDVQDYIISLLEDLAAYGKTGLDGIILDRGRFQGSQSDFSDYTRGKFEAYVGETLEKWPEDVLPVGYTGVSIPSPMPKHYKKWNEFRAKTIHDFMEKASKAVKAVDPNVDFGAYVGAWYGSYYENGVNWASPKYNTYGTYPSWSTPDYKDFGFADHLDVLVLGAYASPKSVYGSGEWTMQGFCRLGYDKVKGDCMVVGGPDVGNWSTTGVSKNEEYEAVKKSVTACANECDGYFLFDMIHLKLQTQKWKFVAEGITELNNQ